VIEVFHHGRGVDSQIGRGRAGDVAAVGDQLILFNPEPS
jgi:hypothetical protein